MTWFERLTGFPEISREQVQENLVVEGDQLISLVNGKAMVCGRFETPSLAQLRERVQSGSRGAGESHSREVVADIRSLHADESLAGSLFQVASQFNLLEMTSPHVTPEDGVGIYENDFTQGPTCAIAAGAGTIYRNYFAPVNGQTGQTAGNQIDCLADLGEALGNTANRLWTMKNGYAMASQSGLIQISNRLRVASEEELDGLRKLLRIGIQWKTQVTIKASKHTVSQAYCSALPIAYCNHDSDLWGNFASLILEATYEATICAAILNSRENGCNRVFLTLVGGGAFGNPVDWIVGAMERVLKRYETFDLDVAIASYGTSKPYVQELIGRLSL